jgi:eukaryotic-like serine/threonine-protein kinase
MFPAEPIPDLIGSYKVVRRLPGVGAAEVYLARSQGPMGYARECELKLMPDTSEGNTGFADELAREAAICARLNHPAVVRVFDFFEHEGKLVLALEHVDGTSLAELVGYLTEKHQKLADTAIYYIGARIAGALADAHAARDEQGNPTPIVHRNLSPDSVIVGVDGEVRLTGFGIGKILGRTPDTTIGRIKGAPGYMAPEQSRGEPVTTKADVYGLGVLLWSLLAARRPPTDGTWPRRITGMRNDLPREVAALVDAALDHFPGTRKITAREMEQWLTKVAPPAKGKAELRDRVAAMRADADAKDEPPPPSSRRLITSSSSSSLQGVRFGPHPEGAPAARLPSTARMPAVRVPEPVKPAAPPAEAPKADPSRTASSDGLPKVSLNLPPPPPASAPEPPTGVRKPPPPPPAGAVRFGPPPVPTPAAPPAAPAALPVREGPTLPSRSLTPAFTPAVLAPTAAVPVVPPDAPPPAAPPARALLAPVLPLAPTPAPPPAEVTSSSIRFGAPPAASPGPASVQTSPVFSSPFGTPAPTPVGLAPVGLAPPTPPVFAAPHPPSEAPPPPDPVPLPIPDPPRRRAPMPSLLTIRPGRRTLSAFGSAVVSAFTATLVVSVALYFFVRRDKGVAPSASASASALHAPAAPPSPSSSAAAPASSGTASAGNPADLPYGFGYLTVVSPASANVYVSGKLAGPVNTALRVRCGRWFIRLAAPQEGRYPEWVSTGETVVVGCQESTRLEMSPHRP